jgi:arginine utilization protein RocB
MAMEDYMPLWGKNYSFDAAVLRQLHIPFLLLGPWGKDLHDRTERVHVPSLTVTLPHTLERIVDCIGSHADPPA